MSDQTVLHCSRCFESVLADEVHHCAPKDHLVWSFEHACWWGADRRGYTVDPMTAGLYTKAEAERIAASARSLRPDGMRNEIAVPLEHVLIVLASLNYRRRRLSYDLRGEYAVMAQEAGIPEFDSLRRL